MAQCNKDKWYFDLALKTVYYLFFLDITITRLKMGLKIDLYLFIVEYEQEQVNFIPFQAYSIIRQ